ncbi:UPF0280 family protein [bacterium]|nr:UPF0280 family protein [bacterium]
MWLRTEGEADPQLVKGYLKQAYHEIEKYINDDKDFQTALYPRKVLPSAPDIIKQMAIYSSQAGVGPMAGVAGAIADYLGVRLSERHPQIICNNGGDIYYKTVKEQRFLVGAPGSPFHNKIEICVPSAQNGNGLCTSSGKSGHSINFGRAYAVTILADNACLADVWATALSNQIMSHLDIDRGLKICGERKGIKGVVILADQYLGAWGEVRLSQAQ